MDTRKLFEKYHSRLVKTGILKSLGIALLIGCAANFLIAFVCYMAFLCDYGFWLALGVLVGIVAVLTPILYVKKYRPTTAMIARLVDKLGLEERLITMYELEHDESYIAMAQREDAQAKLKNVREKDLKMNVPRKAVLLLCVFAFLAIGMTSLNALTAFGVVDSLFPPDDPNNLPPETFTITYSVYGDEGGMIIGDVLQMVKEGEDATLVYAEPDDGYIFSGWRWTDQYNQIHDDYNPVKHDTNVQCDMNVIANFVYFDEVFGMEEEELGEGMPQDQPKDDYEPSVGVPSDQKSPPADDTRYAESIGSSENTTTGKADDDYVIDGSTPFNTEFDYEQAKDDLADNKNLPPKYKDAVGNYYEGMRQSKDNKDKKDN